MVVKNRLKWIGFEMLLEWIQDFVRTVEEVDGWETWDVAYWTFTITRIVGYSSHIIYNRIWRCLQTVLIKRWLCWQVPSQLMERCHLTYIEQGDPVSLEELGAKLCGRSETKTYSAYIEACIQGLLKVLETVELYAFDNLENNMLTVILSLKHYYYWFAYT